MCQVDSLALPPRPGLGLLKHNIKQSRPLSIIWRCVCLLIVRDYIQKFLLYPSHWQLKLNPQVMCTKVR